MTDIQRALFQPQNSMLIADAVSVFPDRKVIECRSADGLSFYVPYDKLAICTGSQGSTFGIPGVLEHAHFLRDVKQSEAIRLKIIENLALAGIPGRSQVDWHRLLHIVIVGGGPTGVEVAGELIDFIKGDLAKLYPERASAMRVTLVEAKELLSSFDIKLREYATRRLSRQGVQLKKGVVRNVTAKEITLQDGTIIPHGLVIWSTGVGPTPFILGLPFAKTKVGRLAVDGYMRVLHAPPAEPHSSGLNADAKVGHLANETHAMEDNLTPMGDVYALGDCCANPTLPLPALAQVAEQQGRYLAGVLNEEAKPPAASSGVTRKPPSEFVYKHLGSMASMGGASAILDIGVSKGRSVSMAGFVSWLAWRSAYLTRLGSVSKRLNVAFNWTMTLIFGRDLSRW
ncbi:MAG: hypothetical protein WDW38_003569 [Sanguina aurantia]